MYTKRFLIFMCAACFLTSPVHATTLVVTDGDSLQSPDYKLVRPYSPVTSAPLPEGRAENIPALGRRDYTQCARTPEIGITSPLIIERGDMLADKIAAWAHRNGYDLSWEAGQYKSEGNLVLDKSFDESLAKIKSAMEINGITLDVIVYENCVVRIVEIE